MSNSLSRQLIDRANDRSEIFTSFDEDLMRKAAAVIEAYDAALNTLCDAVHAQCPYRRNEKWCACINCICIKADAARAALEKHNGR
jgi:hypothetical protein